VTAGETQQAIEATFRIERARLVAGLARVVRDVDLAEELAQDALVVALSEWPRTGVPANPGAWLMAAAKRHAIDALRRDKMRERKHEEIARTLDETSDSAVEAVEAAMDDDLGVAPQGAHWAGRRLHTARRAGSRALGPRVDPPGP
jgi:predicted RNA polymerase sigma factor